MELEGKNCSSLDFYNMITVGAVRKFGLIVIKNKGKEVTMIHEGTQTRDLACSNQLSYRVIW